MTVASRGGSFSDVTSKVGSQEGPLCEAQVPGSGEVSQGTGAHSAQRQGIPEPMAITLLSPTASLLVFLLPTSSPSSLSLYQLPDYWA